MSTLANLRALQADKAEKVARMKAISVQAESAGRTTLTASEQKEWDGLSNEVNALGKQIADAQDEIDREREAATQAYRSQFAPAHASNGPVWVDAKGRPVHVLAKHQRVADVIKAQDREAFKGLEFGDFVRAMILGPRNAAEIKALGEGSDSAGGYTVPSLLVGSVIDALRAKAQVINAGAVTIPLEAGEVSIARLEKDPTTKWHAENAADFAASEPTFGRVNFKARTLISLVKLSRELAEDSANINIAILNAFAQALALELDRVALLGTGSANEPLGIANTKNVGEVVISPPNGGTLTDYDQIVDAIYEMHKDNGGEPTAAIMNPRSLRALNKAKDTTNQPLRRPPAIEKLPFLPTTQVPINDVQGTSTNASRIFIGDYGRLMVGIRTSLRIEILKERYAENFQYGLLAYLRADVALEHPESFAIVKGIVE